VGSRAALDTQELLVKINAIFCYEELYYVMNSFIRKYFFLTISGTMLIILELNRFLN